MRARELDIAIGDLPPGPLNAITDVPGVQVGHATLISGDGPLVQGQGPVRTGVTVIQPKRDIWESPVFGGCHSLNGSGDVSGLEWLRESGMLTTPIALTNTHSLGVVRDALAAAHSRNRQASELFWSLPVVAETYDGVLNDINGQHVRAEHLYEALASASDGPVAEGNVGGGTGMICHEFKGGIGTSSRRCRSQHAEYTVGVLVQANQGRRERLMINGIRVGKSLTRDEVPAPSPPEWHGQPLGSIVAIVATDAPVLPHQCGRLAQRAGLGVARTGGAGENWSGDIFLAFSTANAGLRAEAYGMLGTETANITMLRNEHLTLLFEAVIEATEEAILNALLGAETMAGRDGVLVHALPVARLKQLLAGS